MSEREWDRLFGFYALPRWARWLLILNARLLWIMRGRW